MKIYIITIIVYSFSVSSELHKSYCDRLLLFILLSNIFCFSLSSFDFPGCCFCFLDREFLFRWILFLSLILLFAAEAAKNHNKQQPREIPRYSYFVVLVFILLFSPSKSERGKVRASTSANLIKNTFATKGNNLHKQMRRSCFMEYSSPRIKFSFF